jgi:hypothetical protein
LFLADTFGGYDTYEGKLDEYSNGKFYPMPLLKSLVSLEVDSSSHRTSKMYLECWRDIVRTYSASNLTKERDKLVAISGIARRMEILLGDEYVARIWRHHLEEQLL